MSFTNLSRNVSLAWILLTLLAVTPSFARAKKGKWIKLFDGKSLKGWHSYLKKEASPKWQIEDKAIVLTAKGAGDLLTDQEYENFELEVEWKISEGVNSGILFHVHEDSQFRASDLTGPEMQVLDNERHPNAKQGPNRTAGSLFDMIAPSDPTACKPAGQWNKARIRVLDGHVEYHLNGKKVVEYQIGSPEWNDLLSKSKYRGWSGYARFNKGAIALQDHGDKVWYRAIRLREL